MRAEVRLMQGAALDHQEAHFHGESGQIEVSPRARGHVDCMEVVRDRAVVSAVPEVRVRHPQAKVTHEAAIGSVDSRQLETLMARGMAPDDAVDLIVRGILT